MLVLVRWVILMAPIGVFALVLPMAAHAGTVVAGAIGFYILAYSILCIAITLLLYVVVALIGPDSDAPLCPSRASSPAHRF